MTVNSLLDLLKTMQAQGYGKVHVTMTKEREQPPTTYILTGVGYGENAEGQKEVELSIEQEGP